MSDIKSINGKNLKDEFARQQIENISDNMATKEYVNNKGTFEFNEDGELIVNINGVNKTFIDKNYVDSHYDTINTNVNLVEKKMGCIIPEMFGAKGDGTTDDTQFIQNTIDYAKENNLKIFLPNKKYKIKNTLVIYSNIQLEGCPNCTFDFTELIDNIAINIEKGNENGYNKVVLKNIYFKGYNGNLGFILNNEYINATLFNIKTNLFTIEKCRVTGFNKCVEFDSNSYLISFQDCVFSHNNYAIYFDYTGKTNLGERINFYNCTIGNNNVAVYNKLGMLTFVNSSLDYNHVIISDNITDISGTNSGRVIFNTCHIEDDTDHIEDETRILNNGSIHFVGCEIWTNSTTWAENNSYFFYLSNCDIRSVNKTELISNIPPMISQISYITDYEIRPINFRNSLIDNSFSNITIVKGTTSINNNELTINNEQYASGEVLLNKMFLSDNIGRRIYVQFDCIYNNATPNYKTKIVFYNENDEKISSFSIQYVQGQDYKTIRKCANIPQGCSYARLNLGVEGTGTDKNGIFKNIYSIIY